MIALIITTAVAALSINWAAIYMARSFGLLDIPEARKHHSGAIPLTGGVAIFLTVILGHIAFGIPPYSNNMMIIAIVVFMVGVFDDRRHINATARLFIQFASGIALATFGGIVIVNAGNLLAMGDIPLQLLAIPLTALAVAGLSNAYNMIDGIDGLAASMILLPLLILYGLAVTAGHPMANVLLLMVVPLFVFLVFNLGPDNRLFPKIFLGDGGSVTLGFLVAASLVYFSQGENALILPVTALWLVTVPLMDMIATMLRRWHKGHKLMDADRSHMHHTMIGMGFSPRQTLVFMVGYAALCAFLGIALEGGPESSSLLLYTFLFAGHCVLALLSDRRSRRISEQPAPDTAA
ncbi:MAG: undecaprenyl/decaprenyl-phosphate alpha-N-acetylglucosaminyl 1-phosphate transferase [Proteobacteria bacterium]|nr:undecaprenyl/decaprenyl-phosphate alpha-N-acetylglucosaminyl 1-phosphate transferase [Pseudomonadota bacterium]